MASPGDPNSIASGAARGVGGDFGTDLARSIVAHTTTGSVLDTSLVYHPRLARGPYCDPVENGFRQHPLNHLGSTRSSMLDALGQAGSTVPAKVRGIGADTKRCRLAPSPSAGPVQTGQSAKIGSMRAVRRSARSWTPS